MNDDRRSNARPVDAVVASAGTGKTYTLVERIAAAIDGGLEPSRLLATTFTRKAAAELAGRLREGLIEAGRPDRAAALDAARIGTVNSVAGSLVGDFAFELGRSPTAQVVDETQVATVFDRATGAVMREHAPTLTVLARRLGKDWANPYSSSGTWRDDVQAIVDAARANGIEADALAASAERSLAGLLRILPEPESEVEPVAQARRLDQELHEALAEALHGLDPSAEEAMTKKSQAVVATVREALAEARRADTLAWSTWVDLTNLSPGVSERDRFGPVSDLASRFPQHPRLRADLDAFVRGVFACAADCMRAFAAYKDARGVMDFVDQEALALRIVRDPANHERLADAVGRVYVDEVQDSSPIQLAVFDALAGIADRSVWVGDPKQSIYAFRGADPDLTHAAIERIRAASGGEEAYLGTSYRTRPSLAAFVNAAFGPRLEADGFPPERSLFEACDRAEPEGFPGALSYWAIEGRRKEDRTADLAACIAGLLADTDRWPVWKRNVGTRPARGSDVAVLCTSNADVAALASALGDRGVRVAIERTGLMQQPEVQLVVAALRVVADASDDLAKAELGRLAFDDDAWLHATFAPSPGDALREVVPFIAELDAVRARAAHVTPEEALDAVLQVDGVEAVVQAWGEPRERTRNLEALRDAAGTYQDAERAAGRSVTLSGLCAWLLEDADTARPASRDPDAVQLSTYHRAKGLQWPIVILAGLESKPRWGVFGLQAESEGASDDDDPLAGRTLRYWPWPFGGKKVVEPVSSQAEASREGAAAKDGAMRERIRVLYVGMTRAADHLVLATHEARPARLAELSVASAGDVPEVGRAGEEDPLGPPHVRLEPGAVVVGGDSFVARGRPDEAAGHRAAPVSGTETSETTTFRTPSGPVVDRPPRLRRPSDADEALPGRIAETVRLGDRIALAGDPDLQLLGEAIHRFFAADDPAAPHDLRIDLAERTLRRWGVSNVRASDLTLASERLKTFLAERFPSGRIVHEATVRAGVDERIVQGRLDLVVRTDEGFVLVDHKAFPGDLTSQPDRIDAYAGQLSAYARAVRAATGEACVGMWLHRPLAGVASRLRLRGDRAANEA